MHVCGRGGKEEKEKGEWFGRREREGREYMRYYFRLHSQRAIHLNLGAHRLEIYLYTQRQPKTKTLLDITPYQVLYSLFVVGISVV